MVKLELTNIESERLAKALNTYLSNLRMEIADTDSTFFKEDLKKEKNVLNSILERLSKTEDTIIV
ncbi:MAG: hypothetical protein GTO02_10880 [Candidatus Dadabacteria bacterium]|nr:hypothetical protein [Candidatus Dadabacteria bacterium]NIQ14867.1 hypothetical protein [Candidatus Dadabacteria bacterium]